jgi:D-alanyl-D-alanine carboxypeptidase/D-alanyl-D-alanine carboxypeptidase (penicillin-binding protein 5/6)
MTKINLLALLLFPLVASCSFRQVPDCEVLSEEEIRLDRACHIDTAVTVPPLVEWQDSLNVLSAEAWILVDDATGLLISAKNADKRMYMASLTKMMTCLLALEQGNMGDSIEITDDVFLTKDSKVRPGDGYLLGNLICEMMLQSDNNAAIAIAKHIGGDTEAFCDMMNLKAAYLGMDSTRFANPNGMPNDSNYSSARDLVVLSRYCMGDSVFASIVGTAFMDIPLTDGRHLPCQNTNLLLWQEEDPTEKSWEHWRCIGVKTGYTRQAGSCLASAAVLGDTRLFLILLNSKSRSLRFSESATLLDYGFRVMQERNMAKN